MCMYVYIYIYIYRERERTITVWYDTRYTTASNTIYDYITLLR